MPSLYLTQTDLNASLREVVDVNIMTLLQDKKVIIPDNAVTINGQSLSYTTNPQSLVDFSSLPQINMATFENNSWILDGSFITPSSQYGSGAGDSYSGYISNDMTNDSGNYTTNPVITVQFAAVAETNYISLYFASGIDTSYPKSIKIQTYDETSTLLHERTYTPTSSDLTSPLMVIEVKDTNVKSVAFTFIGTQCPHRRTRLNKIMFGKAELVDPYYLQSWKIDDKASLVADSIPTKTLTYSIINYNGDYNVDNPENNVNNKLPGKYNDTLVFFTLFTQDDTGWCKYTPTKTFNLLDVSTTSEGTVTFTCGSILDVLTETYDHSLYNGSETINSIMNKLLSFSGISTTQYESGSYGSYVINVPIPELPVREIIQRLAFSCGATLTVNDDNKIIFSQKNITPNPNTTPKFMFHEPVPFTSAGILLEEPHAEALSHTTNLGMYTYTAIVDEEVSEVATAEISTINPTKISFSAIAGSPQIDEESIIEQHATIARIDEMYSQHIVLTLAMDTQAEPPIQVKILGRKVTNKKIMPKTANMDTLLLDSGLTYETNTQSVNTFLIKPTVNPNPNIFYYEDWYGAKFKYKCKTRNEYLIKAGDIILFETPFTDGEPTKVGYVLRNTYSNNSNSGEMEVITVGDN